MWSEVTLYELVRFEDTPVFRSCQQVLDEEMVCQEIL